MSYWALRHRQEQKRKEEKMTTKAEDFARAMAKHVNSPLAEPVLKLVGEHADMINTITEKYKPAEEWLILYTYNTFASGYALGLETARDLVKKSFQKKRAILSISEMLESETHQNSIPTLTHEEEENEQQTSVGKTQLRDQHILHTGPEGGKGNIPGSDSPKDDSGTTT